MILFQSPALKALMAEHRHIILSLISIENTTVSNVCLQKLHLNAHLVKVSVTECFRSSKDILSSKVVSEKNSN